MRRRYNPFLLRVLILSYEGHTTSEIAMQTGKSDSYISGLLNSDEAKAIYLQLENQTLDTFRQTQTLIQAAIPAILQEKIRLALFANNEAVRNRAAQNILELGGHVAVQQLEIRKPDQIEEEFRDKSEEDIRNEILAGLEDDKPTTLH
jgi:hypothetical protein